MIVSVYLKGQTNKKGEREPMSNQTKEKVDYIKTLSDWVVVQPEEEKPRETKSGIIISAMHEDKSQETNRIGKVIGLGHGSENTDADFTMDIDVNLDDTVIYQKARGIPVSHGGVRCDLMRGYDLVGKLIDVTTEGMPGIWQQRTFCPFADRVFVEWLEGADSMAGGALVKPEMMKSNSVICRIISMGDKMPKHFERDGVVPGKVFVFDTSSIEVQLHNWRFNGKLYCVVKANELAFDPLLNRVESSGSDMTENLQWGQYND